MREILLYIAASFLILLASCDIKDDFLSQDGWVGTDEVWAKLHFGHRNYEQVDISTRATLSEIAESRIENVFVYIFDHEGKRVYSHFYDYNNKVATLPTTVGNYWTVSNRTSANNNDTEGEVLIKTPTLGGGSIYMVANLNADQLNISSDQLNLVETLTELQNLTVTLNQEITSRTGCFLMTGFIDNVDINEKGEIRQNNGIVRVPLVRLDAKVSVNIVVGEAKLSNQRMKDFVPESWSVMRLPKATQLFESNNDATELGFFDSEENNFESETTTEKSFSFYLLENKKSSLGLTSYHQREERHKLSNGSYDLSKGMWKHVSDDATYLVIKGKVQMEVDTDDEFALQYLEADVTYFVHLGNFGDSKGGGDYNNFTVERNTHYAYTITIRGVESIEVEVETGIENQPGAIGDVYKSTEEVYTYDAHYGQRVYRLNAEAILAKTITWYVKTPFSEGMPKIESGTQVPNLDYKWVWFMVNKLNSNGSYSTKNQWYPGDKYQAVNYDSNDKLMNLVEFVEFLKQEKDKYDAASGSGKSTASAFRQGSDGEYCLYVTVFVDEYFYESHPLNPDVNYRDFWKEFVNKPNRLLHILCDTKDSKDGASSVTQSIITIRQRSIQTPYNISNNDLITAWGCESEDEFISSQLYFYSSSETMSTSSGYSLGRIGATSEVNGLYNSVKIWGITPGVTRWNTYFDYEKDNDAKVTISGTSVASYFMKDNYLVMRYASLMRNRDNDGDGVIDAEEIRWYVASLNQLYDLYIGQLGLNSEAVLYTSEMASQPNQKYTSGPYRDAYKWRNHVVSSSWVGGVTSDAQPQKLWAEEGLSISAYFDRWGKNSPMSIRCVRNLGITNPAYNVEGAEGDGYPTPLVQVSDNGKGGYIFNFKNVNEKSLRYYTSRELEIGNENFETSRVYYGFETGPTVTRTQMSGNDYNNYGNYIALKNDLEAGNETGCDIANGYRVPNVREGALMALYCSSAWWNGQNTMVSTWYSNGDVVVGGTGNDAGFYSWQFGHKFATIGNSGINLIRSVRDLRE